MVQKTVEVIQLGTMGDLDVDEAGYWSGGAASLVGTTFGSVRTPLYEQLELLTLDDANNNGEINSNDNFSTPENVIHNGVSSGLDSVIEYTVSVTFSDGSTAPTSIMLLQDVSGRSFFAPFIEGAMENDALDDGGIRSMEITGIVDASYDGVFTGLKADAFVVCFLEGTLIQTSLGPTRVEKLEVGHMVDTLDHGPQPILWIGSEQVAAGSRTSPIHIGQGALGAGLPQRSLFLSPQHRVMVNSPVAARMFDSSQVFLAAKKLTDLEDIEQPEREGNLAFWHVMFKRHEVIFAEGAPVESFLPGRMALTGLSHTNRYDLLQKWPLLRIQSFCPDAARPCISGRSARTLLRRHRQNGKPILVHRPWLEKANVDRGISVG